MTDEQSPRPQNEAQTENSAANNPFVDELTQLGKHFSQLVKDALESPQMQNVRKEVASGAQTVIDEINEAMNKARSSPVTQEVAQKASRTAAGLKDASLSDNLKAGLLNVMKSVNQELSNLVERMEQSSASTGPENAEAPEEAS
jgi:hypothetical protein